MQLSRHTTRIQFGQLQNPRQATAENQLSSRAFKLRILPASCMLAILALSRPCIGQQMSPLPQIEAGTLVENAAQSRWNAVVLLARPVVSSGDKDSIPEVVQKMVPTFVLTILATVERYADAAAGKDRFRLAEVGVGFSTEVDGQLRVVTPDGAKKVGAELGFIQKRMLQENQKQLLTTRLIARTSTLLVFDVPTLMFREGEHEDFLTRHFVWIDSQTGKNGALVWLMKEDSDGRLSVSNEPLRWIPRGMKEKRKVHVDKSLFLLGGIPTERAFALEDLPPGKPVQWTQAAASVAALPTYDEANLKKLTVELGKLLQTMQKQ